MTPDKPMDDDAFAAHIQTEVVDKLRASACSVTIWSGGVDWKIAIETGAAVLLDKPVILVVAPGTKAPAKVVKIADRIIEAGSFDDRGLAELADKLTAAVNEISGARQ